jgi:hypothetical protein
MSRSKQRNDRDNDVELKPRRPGLSLCRYEYDGRPVKAIARITQIPVTEFQIGVKPQQALVF